MKTRRKRAATKAKSVPKKKASAAAAPPSTIAASPEDHSGIQTLAAATENFAAATEPVAASAALTASGSLNASKKAFLNLVGQIAQESLRRDKSNDVGFHGIRSGLRFSSYLLLHQAAVATRSMFGIVIVAWSTKGLTGGVRAQGASAANRPTEGDVVKGASNMQVTSLSGLHPRSIKEKRSKKSCHDPRYNDKELNICLGVIKNIMDLDEAASFSAPVVPVPLGFPNRVDIPMDFGTRM